jgi:pimeloyl-ACP methyl ester carboxylesterase
VFEDAGYAVLTPGWPDDPETVEEAKANPEVLAGKSLRQIAEHLEDIIRNLERRPAIIGHSFGGLLAEMLAGRGRSVVTVAIGPAPFRGVRRLPFSTLKSAWPLLNDPSNLRRAIPLSYDEFRYAFANALSEEEARQLYDTFPVPAPARPFFQSAGANLNPWTEAKVDTVNPDRGPLLIVSGERDHTVPFAVANASYKRQRENTGLTEFVEVRNRGHALIIDHGWREVADVALGFVRRFAA